MAVNRFMTPAEMPEVSFFQLPQEQMRDALLSAQYQYDDAKDKLTLIGDTSFNHLKNKNDLDLAREVYSKLDQGVNNVLSKQGDGDLRKIRGDIQSLGREVGKWYRPDGDIGKLQSNYLLYNDWYKRQVENKDLDHKYVQDAAETIMNLYDQQGGAKKTSIYTEDLKKHFDYSKFVNDNKDMIKSTLIEREKDRLGNNGYKYTDEQIQKFITPEKIMHTMAEILQSNPEHLSSLTQRIRFKNLPEDAFSTLIPVEKDDKGNIIYGLNPASPAAFAIQGAMRGLGGIEEDKTRFSIGTDEPWFKFWDEANKKAEVTIPGDLNETLTTTQNNINTLQENYQGKVTPEQTQALLEANKEIGNVVLQTVLNPETGEVKPEFKAYFKDATDLTGKKIIPKEEILTGFILSLHDPKNNGGHGAWVNGDVFKTYLESKGYKVNYEWKDGVIKKLGSLFTGLSGASTDLEAVNVLDETLLPNYRLPSEQVAFAKLFSTLRSANKEIASQPVYSQNVPLDIISPNTKNPMYAPFQKLTSLKSFADSYTFYDKTTGKGGTLSEFLNNNDFGENIMIARAKDDPKNSNPNEPQRHFLKLQPLDDEGKPEGDLITIEIMSKTDGPRNQMAAAASNSLEQSKNYWQTLDVGNKTGYQAKGNLWEAAQESLKAQDKKNFKIE